MLPSSAVLTALLALSRIHMVAAQIGNFQYEYTLLPYPEHDCEGEPGPLYTGHTDGVTDPGIHIQDPTPANCAFSEGWKSYRLECPPQIAPIVMVGSPQTDCAYADVGSACTSGGSGDCINLMHPNGEYFPRQQVHYSTGSLCFAGKLVKRLTGRNVTAEELLQG